jgi:glycosyltransferase involved in cell wall biosynthesis
VLVVSGIWPPDVGGPASHAPELAAFLVRRGHGVEVVTTADAEPAAEAYPVRYVSRSVPVGMRHVAVATAVARAARRADVVYATSMIGRASAGAFAARRPIVLKLTADEAYERARRLGLYAGDLDGFQQVRGGVRIRVLRALRDAAARRAATVFCPSAYLRQLAVSWGLPPESVEVLPNPAPELPALPDRAAARAELGIDGPTLAFAGRLTTAKALDVAFAALDVVPDVTLLVGGDGPDRAALEHEASSLGLDGRVRFLGALPRNDVLRLFRAADAALLSSAWENFPHTVVEALAVGTPVISTAVGGVPEVVIDGVNGLLVPPGRPDELGAAIARFFGDAALRGRLSAAAAGSVDELAPERLLGRIEDALLRAARAG